MQSLPITDIQKIASVQEEFIHRIMHLREKGMKPQNLEDGATGRMRQATEGLRVQA